MKKLSVRRNDNEMKRNAVPPKRDLQSHQTLGANFSKKRV